MALFLIPKTEASVYVDATPNPLDRVQRVSATNQLGFGIVRPFRRDEKNDFATAGGVELIKSCVGQILGTYGASPKVQGELEWNPDFGSILYMMRHQNNTTVLAELGKVYVVGALRRFEPRIKIKGVGVSKGIHPVTKLETLLILRILYDVLAVNSTSNAVLFGDIDQTVTLPQAA